MPRKLLMKLALLAASLVPAAAPHAPVPHSQHAVEAPQTGKGSAGTSVGPEGGRPHSGAPTGAPPPVGDVPAEWDGPATDSPMCTPPDVDPAVVDCWQPVE